MPSFSSRLEFGNVLFDGKNRILEVINTTKKGQKVDETMVVKESPFCNSSMNEIRFLSQIKHKSIIRYRGYEKQHKPLGCPAEDKVILFLERAHGGDLYDQLCKLGTFSEEVARNLFIQMVEAVRFLHSQNIAHRDLKLENFLLMEKSCDFGHLSKTHIKLADFEFACERTENSPRRQDRAGTEEYLSPEQVQGEYCPFKSDVWAIGVALYLMVCGKFPQFNLSKYGELELPQELSPELQALLKSILQSDEETRLTIEEVKRHNWTTGHAIKGHNNNGLQHKGEHVKKMLWPHFHLPIRVH